MKYISSVFPLLFLSVVGQHGITEAPSKCGENSGTFCTGCRSMNVCLSPDISFPVECDDSQYCNMIDNGLAICDDWVPVGCETTTTTIAPPAASLTCTGVGIYPDPYDCNAYHYCMANLAESEVHRCPVGYGFHYTSEASDGFPCRKLESEMDCLKVTCSGQSVFDEYDTAKLFYAHCHTNMKTGLQTIAMYRCTDGASFNGYNCVFRCTEEGLYANTIQPNTYYQCQRMSGGTLGWRLLYCPRNAVFDNSSKKCV
ncbi:uncharacterized protein LOC131438274 [Malaya genurostris]|uniref:uncharacterized protein LOC131438274 n=1 Tax=Malaya genurostris TaxID=325434 RepID=UPI0026F3C197|nr:uncharacterized protein LOC131438274 [Malaya genurostris]